MCHLREEHQDQIKRIVATHLMEDDVQTEKQNQVSKAYQEATSRLKAEHEAVLAEKLEAQKRERDLHY